MTLDPTQPTDSFQPAAPEPGPYQVPAQPVAVAKSKPPTGMTSWINIALGLALVIAVGGVAFAAGRLTAPATAAANGGNGRTFPGGGNFPGGGYFGGGNFPGGGYFGGRNGGLGGGTGGASIQGTVTAVGPDSITITTAGGQSITIGLDSATTYHQQSSATSGDVKTGGTVIVRLGFRGQDGPTASGAGRGLSATDVTVVP